MARPDRRPDKLPTEEPQATMQPMTGAALQPFVTSQRQEGVAGARLTSTHLRQWTWQASPDAPIQGHLTATTAPRQRLSTHDQPNKLGSYYCWNRVYEPSTGRWTSPDPAQSPWSNLWDIVAQIPTGRVDSTGLNSIDVDFGGTPLASGDTNIDSLKDFKEHVAEKYKEGCIDSVRILGHGVISGGKAGGFFAKLQAKCGTDGESTGEIGIDESDEDVNIPTLTSILTGKMCKPCTITLDACRIGEDSNKTWLQAMADKTGCTVKALKSVGLAIGGVLGSYSEYTPAAE